MEEQFVTYEIVLKLKELGFNEPCFGWYSYEEFNPLRIQKCETYLGIESCTKAPLWQQAIDWFRVKYLLDIHILPFHIDSYHYRIDSINGRIISSINTSYILQGSSVFVRSFNMCREQAILKALELIK